MSYGYIYRTNCRANGKVYVGQKLFASGFRTYYSPETRMKISAGRKRYWALKKAGLWPCA
jgi:hypothetical protein